MLRPSDGSGRRSINPSRTAALACLLGIGVVTVVYHLPANPRFVAGTIAQDDVAGALDWWLALHVVRIALGVTAAAFGVIAVSREAAVRHQIRYSEAA